MKAVVIEIKNLPIEEYFNKIKPHLEDTIIDL